MDNTILFVDDEKNILNSLVRLFRREGYNILTAEGGHEALELIARNKVDLVISDHRMPVMDGVEFLSKVKESSPDTIRFMLTGYAELKAVMAAINKGEVYRYITKPWNDEELKRTVEDAVEKINLLHENKRLHEVTKRQNALLVDLNKNLEKKVDEKTKKIRENFFAFVKICADLMELYDQHAGGHNKRVASMAKGIGMQMELDNADLELIESAALLHNIGLIGAPKDIFEKEESSLQENEKAILRHNPILSQDLLSSIDSLRQVGIIIRSQMEGYNGGGYPDGLKNEEIHLGARIIAVCKLFDILRHGRERLDFEDAINRIKAERGLSFDPIVVDTFIDYAQRFRNEVVEDRRCHPSYCEIELSNIRGGMALAKNLVTSKGRLLVTAGTVLTNALIEKVLNFNKIEPITEAVRIVPPAVDKAG
ncbi:MAG: response regulator [Deltaproteobacteria bacterium]|nr:response regulator [Deltaproteobacteria bacterium]